MLFFGLLLLAASQGQVHVVDAAGGPGADFTTLNAAVSAAAGGDVVLVRAGDYFVDGPISDGIFLNDKGLTVVADSGAVVRTSNVRIQDLAATDQVLIQGLTFRSSQIVADLDDDLGPLWFEGCAFEPQFDLTAGGFFPTGCDSVVLARCQLATVPLITPTTALLAQDSRLHVFDSTLQGSGNNNPLATVVLRQGAFLQLFGSSVHGGDGAPGTFFLCDGLPGGDAASLEGVSTLVTLDATVQGGAGGAPYLGSCNAGADGEDVVVTSGTVVPLAGAARSLEVASPVRTDEQVLATLTGLPGDRVWFRYSLVPGTGQASPFYDGELLLGSPRYRAFTATLPASGTLVVTASAPQLAAGMESLVVYCQAFFRDAAGQRFVLSSPSAMVLVDAGF